MTHVYPRRVRHRSMADQVAAELRRMVLSGAFDENERLTQDKLAKMLGVSTMPVREALLRLTAEGLVVTTANRSFVVASNRSDDIRDTYWAFGQIAGELAYRACLAHGADLVKPLSDLHAAHKASVDDADARFRANWQFHRTINLSAGSPRLLQLVRSTMRFFPDLLALPGSVELAERWQRDLIRAFKTGDAEKARKISHTYARKSGELFVVDRETNPKRALSALREPFA